jgi:hypothetical protein
LFQFFFVLLFHFILLNTFIILWIIN